MPNQPFEKEPFRVLIVIKSLYIGGFTKSLINLLQCMSAYPDIAIDIWMLEPSRSALSAQIPSGVHMVEDKPYTRTNETWFRYWFSMERVYYVVHQLARRLPVGKWTKTFQMFLRQHMDWNRAKKLSTDFSFAEKYDCVVSWEEVRCNYVAARNIIHGRKVGYVRPNYRDAGFCPSIDKKCFKKLDAVATVSKADRETLAEIFPGMAQKFCCVPNRKNIAAIRRQAAAASPILEKKGLTLVSATRLDDRSKALFRQVRIVKELRRRGCVFTWYMIGDGPDRQAFEAAINSAGLQDTIVLLGAMDNPMPYVCQADLFVLQSYYEGRPNAVDEAKILGVPVFVSDYASAKDQVAPDEGFVAPNEEGAITDALETVLKNPEQLVSVREALAGKNWSAFEDCSAFFELIGAPR